MKVFVLSLAFLALASATSFKSQFEAFEHEFGKKYTSSAERLTRFATFMKNVKEIEEHNNSGKYGYKKVINKFADMTQEEFGVMNGYKNAPKPGTVYADIKDIKVSDLPTSVDWRDKGAISDVKDQGYCGSCWAFATAETIESYLQIESGNSVVEELSAQHITSCTPNELSCGGSGGCQGSIPQLGFVYTQLFGLTKEEDYPYTSGNSGSTGSCDFESTDTMATVRGYETLPRNNLEAVMNHLANEGDYWIIRNSWGPNWGENGFMRLKRESTAVCGTDDTPLMGTGCVDDGNDVLHVCGQCGVLFDVCYPIGADYIEPMNNKKNLRCREDSDCTKNSNNRKCHCNHIGICSSDC